MPPSKPSSTKNSKKIASFISLNKAYNSRPKAAVNHKSAILAASSAPQVQKSASQASNGSASLQFKRNRRLVDSQGNLIQAP